jgi:hypothetical protein
MNSPKKIFVSALLLVMPGIAAAGQFSLGTGVDYSSGDYGADVDTDILYVPFNVKYDTERWFYRLTIPYIRIRGPGAIVLGPDGEPIDLGPTGVTRRETTDGLGDVIAGVTYNIVPPTETGFIADIGAKVKFGTADEDDNLGTGEEDYSLQGDLYKTVGRWTALGTLGYRWLGDPSGFDLKNGIFGTVGAIYKFTDATSGGLLFDYRERSTSRSESLRELTAYVGTKLTPDLRFQLYAVTGFSDSSADWGAGAAVTYDF